MAVLSAEDISLWSLGDGTEVGLGDMHAQSSDVSREGGEVAGPQEATL